MRNYTVNSLGLHDSHTSQLQIQVPYFKRHVSRAQTVNTVGFPHICYSFIQQIMNESVAYHVSGTLLGSRDRSNE